MSTTPEARRIMTRLAAKRCSQRLTQEVIAERIGVTRETVIRWENGRSEPTASHLQGYCMALGYRLAIVPVEAGGAVSDVIETPEGGWPLADRHEVAEDAFLWSAFINGAHVRYLTTDPDLQLFVRPLNSFTRLGGELCDKHGVTFAGEFRYISHRWGP